MLGKLQKISNIKNTKQGKKQSYKIVYNSRKIYHTLDVSRKSAVTIISFNFLDEGKIILACYYMNKKTNQSNTFRADVRSRAFVYYLRKVNY